MSASQEVTPLPRRLPLALKVALAAFLCVQVPIYWSAYGPTNFLYFCDVALFLTLASVLTEKPLFASMAAVGILLPQCVWVIDFVGTLVGHPVVGMTSYMFQGPPEGQPWHVRAISLFHGWLPFLLMYLVYRLGYDRRALVAWTVLAWGLMLIAYFLLPAPPAPVGSTVPVNVNYVFGTSDDRPQEWMPPLAWFAFMMVSLPLVFFVPMHLLLNWLIGSSGVLRRERRPHAIVAVEDPQVPPDRAEVRVDAVE